jgi:hypothetical protein
MERAEGNREKGESLSLEAEGLGDRRRAEGFKEEGREACQRQGRGCLGRRPSQEKKRAESIRASTKFLQPPKKKTNLRCQVFTKLIYTNE